MNCKLYPAQKVQEKAGDIINPFYNEEDLYEIINQNNFQRPVKEVEDKIKFNILNTLIDIISENNSIKFSGEYSKNSDYHDQNDFIRNNSIFITKNLYKMPFEFYFHRMIKYLNPEFSTFIISMIFLHEITVNEKNYIKLNENNIHKIFFSVFYLAIKFNEESCYHANYMSKIGGISVKNLIKMEAAICNMLNFKLFVNKEKYDLYYEYFLDY